MFCASFSTQPMVVRHEDPYLRWLKHAGAVDAVASTIRDPQFFLKHSVRFAVRTIVLAAVMPLFRRLKHIGSHNVGSIERTLMAMVVQLVIQNHHDWYEDLQNMRHGSECTSCGQFLRSRKICGFLMRCYSLGFVASMLDSRQRLAPFLESC